MENTPTVPTNIPLTLRERADQIAYAQHYYRAGLVDGRVECNCGARLVAIPNAIEVHRAAKADAMFLNDEFLASQIVTGSARRHVDGQAVDRVTVLDAMDLRDSHLPYENLIHYYVHDDNGELNWNFVKDPEWTYHINAQLCLRAVIIGI